MAKLKCVCRIINKMIIYKKNHSKNNNVTINQIFLWENGKKEPSKRCKLYTCWLYKSQKNKFNLTKFKNFSIIRKIKKILFSLKWRIIFVNVGRVFKIEMECGKAENPLNKQT